MDMDLGHPTFPSSPSLLYDFDGAFSSSEGSTPADSPTFYKCGESSRLAEMKPVFHSSVNDTYKVWWNDNLRGEESDLSYFPCQHSNQETGLWEDVEMGFNPMPCGSPYNQRSRHNTATQWPTRDNTVPCSIPVSVARSSLCQQTSQTSFGMDWCGSPLEDDLFGPVSPLSSISFEQDGSHPSLIRSRPHNYPYDSTGSPYLYRPSASSQSAPNISLIAIASPNSLPSSPSLASSYSSSVSASSSSCPPTPPTPVLLPELHQPRPARPIPIIPLSKLATACEEFYIPSRKSSSVFPKLKHSFSEIESSDLLSPMFTKSDNRYSFPPGWKTHDTLGLQYFSDGKPDGTYPYFSSSSWSGHSR